MNTKMTFIIILCAAFTSCLSGSVKQECSQEINATPCIDLSNVDTNAFCTQEWDPVCGCDEVTYSNECVAAQSGVQHWAQGECCP